MVQLQGRILDVGAGESTWCEWLPKACICQGIDIENAQDYDMGRNKPDVTYFGGVKVPFSDATFDSAIGEVLAHVADPEGLLLEIERVLKDGAPLLLTAPWSARRHHIPTITTVLAVND